MHTYMFNDLEYHKVHQQLALLTFELTVARYLKYIHINISDLDK